MIRFTKKVLLISLALFMFGSFIFADTLVLKDGGVLQGTFKGGDGKNVSFEVKGELQKIPINEITTITFSPRKETIKEESAEQTAVGSVTVPAGSRILVKLIKPVSTATHKKGSSVSAVLATGLAVDGQIVVPIGTKIHGKVLESRGGKAIGGSRIVMTFTDLEINNQLVPIVTGKIGAESGRGGAVKKVGAGALMGLAIDGGEGAGKGAAAAGALALLGGRRNHIQLPPDYQIEVSLEQPLKLNK